MSLLFALFAVFALGAIVGLRAGRRMERRRDAASAPRAYDPENPINGRLRDGRKMIVCGAEWTVYGGNVNG